LVTFEGIDGSGKSSLAKEVYGRLKARGVDAILTSEPTKGWVGDAVRKGIDEGLDPLTQALLFLADRAAHAPQIRTWLEEGKVVLCDRYADSTFAYQGVAMEGILPDPPDWLRRVGAPFTLSPDLTFLLVLEPREALARIAGRRRTLYEKEAYLARVQQRYRALARESRFVELDSSRSLGDLADEALKIMLKRFPPQSRGPPS
jgi:dTMP kinase